MRTQEDEEAGRGVEDPEEPVISLKRGVHSVPWHPGSMSAPHVYKICLIGPKKAGKSSIAYRLVSHTFDPAYRPTHVPSQLFWRYYEQEKARDILVEIEDTPGVDMDVDGGACHRLNAPLPPRAARRVARAPVAHRSVL